MIPLRNCKILTLQDQRSPPAPPRGKAYARKWAERSTSPLALICCLLSLLQLLQSCCQTLLGSIQLFLNQLDASVQRSDIGFSLGRESERHFRVGGKWEWRFKEAAEMQTLISNRKPGPCGKLPLRASQALANLGVLRSVRTFIYIQNVHICIYTTL